MLKIVRVYKCFDEKSVLKGINLEFPYVGLILIKGANGSGKTTLLNLIGGLDIPDEGYIEFDGKKIPTTEEELCRYRSEIISFIFQENNLFENMTARDNINIMGEQSEFKNVVSKLGIEKILDKKVKVLSGGEKARVTIARAILKNSPIILADEPTAAVDLDSKVEVLELLKDLSKTRLVILVSHDKESFEPELADETIYIEEGTIKSLEQSEVKGTKVSVGQNEKGHFEKYKFTLKNLFVNPKFIIRNCLLLVISFLFVTITLILAATNIIDRQIDTMNLENENMVKFFKRSPLAMGDGYFEDVVNGLSDEDIGYLEKNDFSDKRLMIGYIIREKNRFANFNFVKPSTSFAMYPVSQLTFYSQEYIEPDYGRKAIRKDEVIISSGLANDIITFGLEEEEEGIYKPESFEKILADKKPLTLGGTKVTIVGIYDFKVEKMKTLEEYYNDNPYAVNMYNTYKEKVLGDVYVHEDFYSLFEGVDSGFEPNFYIDYEKAEMINDDLEHFSGELTLRSGDVVRDLASEEIIINDKMAQILELDRENCTGQTISLNVIPLFGETDTLKLTVRGISQNGKIIMNSELLAGYRRKTVVARYATLVEPDKKVLKKIFDEYYNKIIYGFDSNYRVQYSVIKSNLINKVIVLAIFSVIFVVLAIFYIINHLLKSIENHRRDIAILKSLGIKDEAIMSSFTLESLVVNLGSFLIAIIIYLPVSIMLDVIVTNKLFFKTNLIPVRLDILICLGVIVVLINLIVGRISLKKIKKVTPQVLFHKDEI